MTHTYLVRLTIHEYPSTCGNREGPGVEAD